MLAIIVASLHCHFGRKDEECAVDSGNLIHKGIAVKSVYERKSHPVVSEDGEKYYHKLK